MAPALAPSPILNGPYDSPARHFEMSQKGPTGRVLQGRRRSESFVPIASTRKGARTARDVQDAFDLDLTGERREANALINDLRRDVERWRHRGYDRVTPTSRNLLLHWADAGRDNRVLFCQREAAETAIFLAEVAGRHGYADWRARLAEANAEHNDGLPRVALKMATGAGKTVVMAMLIAWQTCNKVASPRDTRFAKRFLVVTPGITIRDRLQVLRPALPGNYYDERDLVPAELKGALKQAQLVITNYHAFLLRDAKEIKGVAGNTRKLLLAGRLSDPFRETPDAMVSRVLRPFSGSSEQVVVLNDEAHHCYSDKPLTSVAARLSKEEQDANADARVWFKGLQAVQRKLGVKTVFDLSATPYYLGGSGYREGYIFPWTVSDFSLMDAIESGIVKIPRTPVDDDATGDLVTYLHLWEHVGDQLPKKRTPVTVGPGGWVPPKELEGALHSLYRSYEASYAHWERSLGAHGEPPPVFIVVCPNTVVSKLVHDWIAGGETTAGGLRPGELGLFSNVEDGRSVARPRTILVDSAQLESGDGMKGDFKTAAASEIEAFKADLRRRSPGLDTDTVTDEDLLREVLNTVGKRGKLGEEVRCVVSVAMLTEGWDANTVTHVLGVRAFGSQLLCEQVVGRGLRRRSYAVDPETGLFDAEYANVYGIPFAFIPSDRATAGVLPRPPAVLVESLPDRQHLRIMFPRLVGYLPELPDEELIVDQSALGRFLIGPSTVPIRTELAGIVGVDEVVDVTDLRLVRPQQVAYTLARQLLVCHFTGFDGQPKPWYFPRVVAVCLSWLNDCIDVADGFTIGHLLTSAERRAEAVEAIDGALSVSIGERRMRLRPLLDPVEPNGSTGDVFFPTRKATMETERSEVSHVTLDGPSGNTWEQILALECELPGSRVAAYAKNDHLGFVIPYVHQGRSHSYVPDFLVRLDRAPGENFDRTLVVEVSGGRKSPGPTAAKAKTARDKWCAAVNNHGGFGRWGYTEITDMVGVRDRLAEAIDLLYADDAIIGDPDRLDFAETQVARAAS